MKVLSFSEIGKRPAQQDFIVIDETAGLYIVCDGVGGRYGGSYASKFVANGIKDHFNSFPEANKETLAQAMEITHKAFCESLNQNPELHGMATTCAMMLIRGDQMWSAHAGDSKVLLKFKDQNTFFETKDHSLVQEMVDSGLITEAQRATHPMRNRITKAFTAELPVQAVEPTIDFFDRSEFSFICILSDGILETYSTQEIVDHFTRYGSDAERWEEFKANCMEQSRDNMSLIYIEF